ncbi:DUF389 domain-containing protein [Streptomonospora nanhaiensis]|uniref:Putative hydrophobic protein (TIGR00271 family) n=1 Tax=Streptomonospora nanhaiensis TaxID=1323731 RepID=A0A853BQC2_9ACTN|nr:DUF389 domain-containing protein [Streptomonospora nanhaiensis]MBV2364016.1 DUF389 domain-containing protein [Streptomonospora nanhaiensis]MBX9387360.1 DUF389 domain-containing protein [Streptomonospora nanhaiensis]NYI97014.1 putative hydrophobic protein (TIGR00271 family) [Streptomonospora nanhaiensis]
MLHLRVITPRDRTDDVLAVLERQVGVAHVVVFRDAAVRPRGDSVEADLARECVDSVLSDLADLEIDRRGAITLEALETTLSDSADVARAKAPGHGDEAVVWDELISRADDESHLNWVYLTFLTLGLMISAVGVVTNSPVTVVGAMAVAPDFGPLAAFGVGIVGRRWDLVRQSTVTTAVGFTLAMAITAVFVLLLELSGLVSFSPPGFADGSQVDFIYDVGPFSLIVALLAGAAGMLSLVSAKSAALVGVFISVTTVPAAAYAVVAVTLAEWQRAVESLEQLVINLVGIMVAATLVLAVRTGRDRRKGAPGRSLSSR